MEVILPSGGGVQMTKQFSAVTYISAQHGYWIFDIPPIGFVPDLLWMRNTRVGAEGTFCFIDYVENFQTKRGSTTSFSDRTTQDSIYNKIYISQNASWLSATSLGPYYYESAPIEILAIRKQQ